MAKQAMMKDKQFLLLVRLIEDGNFEECQRQAIRYINDLTLGREASQKTALCILQKIYEGLSSAACGQVLSKSNKLRTFLPQYSSLVALCQMCARMGDIGEINKCAEKLNLEHLRFAPRLHVDALLCLVQATEWKQNGLLMLNYASDAKQLDASRHDVQYWYVRAALNHFDSLQADFEFLAPLITTPPWLRLQLLVNLMQKPMLTEAEKVVNLLTDETVQNDLMEQTLIVKILNNSLSKCVHLHNHEHLIRSAEIALKVEAANSEQTWTSIIIARKQLCVDSDYGAVVARLEARVEDNEEACIELWRMAKILAGNAQCLADTDVLLSGMERAVHALLNPNYGELDNDVLNRDLDSIIHATRFVSYPVFVSVAAVLKYCLSVVFSDGTVDALKPPLNQLPAWCQWLFIRVCLLHAEQDAAKIADKDISHTTAMLWGEDFWARNYSHGMSRVASLERASEALAQANAYRPSAIADYVLEARKNQYRKVNTLVFSAMSKVSLDWGLDELGNDLCNAELILETRYIQARHALVDGRLRDAINAFRTLLDSLDQYCWVSEYCWRPVLTYWLAVSYAHVKDTSSEAIFKQLLSGPKAADAQGQLALLAIQNNDLQAAEIGLATVSKQAPSIVYAQALLFLRRGNDSAAQTILSLPVNIKILTGSVYEPAAQRLMVVIDKRKNQSEAAEQTNVTTADNGHIFKLWQTLTELGEAYQDTQALATCLNKLTDTLHTIAAEDKLHDVLLSEYYRLGQWISERKPINASAMFGEDIFRYVLQLWHADDTVRKQAASQIKQHIEKNDCLWTDARLVSLEATVACVLDDRVTFMGCYAQLSDNLDAYPVTGVSIWLTAADYYLKSKNWSALLEAELPTCVDDVSDAEVHRLLAIAYGRAAIDDVDTGDVRAAKIKTQQARDLLDDIQAMRSE